MVAAAPVKLIEQSPVAGPAFRTHLGLPSRRNLQLDLPAEPGARGVTCTNRHL